MQEKSVVAVEITLSATVENHLGNHIFCFLKLIATTKIFKKFFFLFIYE